MSVVAGSCDCGAEYVYCGVLDAWFGVAVPDEWDDWAAGYA